MRDYNFGNFISELRLARGLSQYQLGALVGVTNKAVSKWENGSSKPKSELLHKLASVLEVTADELLSCKLKKACNDERKNFLMKQLKLWEKVQSSLEELYSKTPCVEILTRFKNERAALDGRESFTYLDVLSALTAEADAFKYDIIVQGTLASSFVAYLLGATKINPLPAHYRCPKCKRVIMMHDYANGWDLPHRVCDCGADMVGDGHDIPFDGGGIEARKVCFSLVIAPSFYDRAIDALTKYDEDHSFVILKRDGGKAWSYLFFLPHDESRPRLTVEKCTEKRYNELYNFPYFVLGQSDTLDRLREISLLSGTRVDDLRPSRELLKSFQAADTDGVFEFSSDFMKDMLNRTKPQSFHELIKLSGLAHGTGTWLDVGIPLLESGRATLSEIPAFRDDVFALVLSKMTALGLDGAGFAYEVSSTARKGLYTVRGMNEQTRHALLEIGMPEWFTEALCKVLYMFPKAHGVYYVRVALALMHLKMNYPAEFNRIFLK